MDTLLNLFIQSYSKAASFRPRSSMDDNWDMARLMGAMSDGDSEKLMQQYLACTPDEMQRKIGFDAHLYFLEQLSGSPLYALTDANMDTLAGLYGEVHPASLILYHLVPIFISRGKSLKPLWQKSLEYEIGAADMANTMTHYHNLAYTDYDLATEIVEFLKQVKNQYGNYLILSIVDHSKLIGDEYELWIDDIVKRVDGAPAGFSAFKPSASPSGSSTPAAPTTSSSTPVIDHVDSDQIAPKGIIQPKVKRL